jgi:hypothetical protein
MKKVLLTTALAATLSLAGAARDERLDYDALYRIKEEGLQRSQVMEITSWLTDIHGPRLTGSPNIRAAAGWATTRMEEWGLANVVLEPWGAFGRGWSNERFAAHVVAPQAYPLIGYPKAWSPGTNGPVVADAVFAPIESEADFATYKGQLAGKFVLSAPLREVREITTALSQRYTDKDLVELSSEDDVGPRRGRQYSRANIELARKRLQFYKDEGALAIVDAGRGDGGTRHRLRAGGRDPRGAREPDVS